MPKIKELFPNIFGTKSFSAKENLESDALPVDTVDSVIGPPTAASESFGQSSDVSLTTPNQEAIATASSSVSPPNSPNSSNTFNTTYVNNTQGQVVMQLSHMNSVHFGSVYNIGRNERINTETNKSPIKNAERPRQQRRTTTVVAMMNCHDPLDHRLRETISAHLGQGWKDVMRAIGLSEGQIEQGIIDHQIHGGIKEVIYQLLLQWSRNAEDCEATVSRATQVLWDMNHRDCVQRMKVVWKLHNEHKQP